jgi:excisionase family DNA binding protein
MQGKKLFGLREGSEQLGVSRSTLRKLARSGQLQTVRILGKVLIPRSEINRLARQGVGRYAHK